MRKRLGRFARIAVGAALLAGPMAHVATAQNADPNDVTGTDYHRRDRSGDFGLLGLIGLFGLFGLRNYRAKTYTSTTTNPQATRHA